MRCGRSRSCRRASRSGSTTCCGRLEELELNAVRPAGLVRQPTSTAAILVTRYLEGSWQYRRLFLRLPPDQPKHRSRLLDAMASLLVELHRHGVFWGDCSLANTLFSRDGQVLQAWLVDAETSEVHPQLSDGQRELDIDILVENVAAGLIDDLRPASTAAPRCATRSSRGAEPADALRGAVGAAARRAGVRLRRSLPGGGPDPASSTSSASPSTRCRCSQPRRPPTSCG